MENEEKIARVLVAVTGKFLTDAPGELKRVSKNVDGARGMSVLRYGDKLSGVFSEIYGGLVRLLMGVFAMIATFNFAAMVPFWFILYPLATGNAFIVSAFKQVPRTMQLITEFIDQCGFPAGVFYLVNGAKEVLDAFTESHITKGISLVASTSTCRIVGEKCA